MKAYLFAFGLASIFFGVGLMLEDLLQYRFQIGISFLSLGSLILLIWGYLVFSNWMWPIGQKEGWSSKREQRAGLDCDKQLTKPRVISELKVMQGKMGQYNCPKRWKATLIEEDSNNVYEFEGNDFIEVHLSKPRCISGFTLTIVEPRLSKDKPSAKEWAFEYIQIKEVRARHIWEKVVYATFI